MVTLRVGLGPGLARAGCVGKDAVPDGDLLGADEDVLDEQASTRWRCPVPALAALPCSWVRKPSRLSASLRLGVVAGEPGVEGVYSGEEGRVALQPGEGRNPRIGLRLPGRDERNAEWLAATKGLCQLRLRDLPTGPVFSLARADLSREPRVTWHALAATVQVSLSLPLLPQFCPARRSRRRPWASPAPAANLTVL